MTAKKKVAVVKPVATKQKQKTNVQTITISPEQMLGFLNRITGVLERVEQLHPAPAEYPGIERSVNAALPMNGLGDMAIVKPSAPSIGLSGMISISADTAHEAFAISQDIVDRLRGGGNPNNATAAQKPSSGPTKDCVETVQELTRSTIANLRTIGEYIFA